MKRKLDALPFHAHIRVPVVTTRLAGQVGMAAKSLEFLDRIPNALVLPIQKNTTTAAKASSTMPHLNVQTPFIMETTTVA